MKESIVVKGAKVHNLKNIDVEIPKNKLTVITGLSGSGKSSLAFDTLYAEGQRRYVESLSAYARQFLDRLDKPDVDQITGLSPAISIDQKTRSQNPRSTVGTVTEILDYLRLFFASVGKPKCPSCGEAVHSQSAQEIKDNVCTYLEDDDVIMVYAPLIVGKKGTHVDTFSQIKQDGFSRVRVNGKIFRVDDEIKCEKNKKHDVDVVVDRITMDTSDDSRLFESIETALSVAKGHVVISCEEKGFDQHYSEQFACADCNIRFPDNNRGLISGKLILQSAQANCSE
jgi:excinuclease ABC subunit A